jgi:hypothetical protein
MTKFSNVSREEVLETLINERKLPTTECNLCNKVVCKKSMKKHLTVCKGKQSTSQAHDETSSYNIDTKDQALLSAFLNILHTELKQFKKELLLPQHTITNVINNNISNNINININSFGNEDLKHITTDFLSHCLCNPTKGISRLIENIHYNDDIPENRNIRFKSNKSNTFEKYLGDQWIECDASNTLDELIRKGYRVLNQHYMDNFMYNPEYDDEMKRQSIERFRFLADTKCLEYYSVKRDIRLLVKNKTFYVVVPPESNE